MKKWLFVLLLVLLTLSGCGRNEATEECVLSSQRMIWGNRVYYIGEVPDVGWCLCYHEIGDEDMMPHPGCIDPLCNHSRENCVVRTDTSEGDIAIVPRRKGGTIYYFRQRSDLDEVTHQLVNSTELRALDLASGKCRVLFSMPYRLATGKYLVTEEYVYLTLNSMTMSEDSHVQTINIWRIPTGGGEPEQCTFSEGIDGSYQVEYYADGALYYRRGDTLCRTTDDFATEEVVMEGLNLYWKVEFRDGWLYHTVDREVVVYKPDEPQAEGYDHVYGYTNEQWVGSVNSPNSCTIVRTRLDGSGTTETLVSGVAPAFGGGATPSWCVVGDTLYCVPTKFSLQGTFAWSERESPNSISYFWSSSGGTLLAVDLKTGESRAVYTDLGYDILSMVLIGDDRLYVEGQMYDVDAIRARWESEPHYTSPGYRVWAVLEID